MELLATVVALALFLAWLHRRHRNRERRRIEAQRARREAFRRERSGKA
jgi:hypothetical protein